MNGKERRNPLTRQDAQTPEGKELTTSLLATIDSPQDLKGLSLKELERLAAEIRTTLIETVARTGGHLAPNLGVVELTLALHYAFDSPNDRIVWDVGHQCYTHKLLTGRRDQFHTLRQYGGISGFPKRQESRHDAFGAGHASTSISAALGMATAKDLKVCPSRIVAVIGDGSMTGGMALEALNHAGDLGKDLIVVLNDNEMSISPNVGAFSSLLSRKLSSRTVMSLKKELETTLRAIPGVGTNILQLLKKSEDSFRAFFTPGMLFQALRFHYIGPIQGHRLERLIETFETAKNIRGPVLIHVGTVKGKGYHPAECDPATFHGVGCFDVRTGESPSPTKGAPPSYTSVFGRCLVELAEKDPRIVAITAAMPQGTGLVPFSELYPSRFFDVGIAEQHAVTFAAGLAAEGYRPVVAVYSTFLQRAYDQVVHDVCLQNLPVVFAMDRGGLVGEDGPTHHGVFDLSYLRHLPNMTVMAPKDENELRRMLKTALEHRGPIALRYPRGRGLGVALDEAIETLPIGRGEVVREGSDAVLVAIGHPVAAACRAAERLEQEGIRAAVINARFVKPLDKDLLLDWVQRTKLLVTIEENALQGGFGSAVLECLADAGCLPRRVARIGIPDAFIQHGKPEILRKEVGLDAESIARTVRTALSNPHGACIRAIG
ncbi:1-deoxy-D-xylulose-5-phosphate synthase [Desulfacinum hydrothermale]|uniref:1-deoxy-D-xylulose-5-phosphate synthase n=1 Tax=Desulfacinum hydrothermale TaxID=109258 RepID=UPI000A008D05